MAPIPAAGMGRVLGATLVVALWEIIVIWAEATLVVALGEIIAVWAKATLVVALGETVIKNIFRFFVFFRHGKLEYTYTGRRTRYCPKRH